MKKITTHKGFSIGDTIRVLRNGGNDTDHKRYLTAMGSQSYYIQEDVIVDFDTDSYRDNKGKIVAVTKQGCVVRIEETDNPFVEVIKKATAGQSKITKLTQPQKPLR